jgi:hypothetical protein
MPDEMNKIEHPEEPGDSNKLLKTNERGPGVTAVVFFAPHRFDGYPSNRFLRAFSQAD